MRASTAKITATGQKLNLVFVGVSSSYGNIIQDSMGINTVSLCNGLQVQHGMDAKATTANTTELVNEPYYGIMTNVLDNKEAEFVLCRTVILSGRKVPSVSTKVACRFQINFGKGDEQQKANGNHNA